MLIEGRYMKSFIQSHLVRLYKGIMKSLITAKEKPMRKNEILTVDVSNYGQPNSAWRVSLERSRNVKYVASVKNGKINKVYTVENAKKREDGRVNFKLVTASDDVQKKYKNFDVSRRQGQQNPCRYYKAL